MIPARGPIPGRPPGPDSRPPPRCWSRPRVWPIEAATPTRWPCCEHYLRLQGPSAAAYYLMGVIHQAAGDRRRAEECFHKAVYLEPGHDAALLALALLAERRGDASASAAFRRRAERAVLKKGAR